MLPFDDLVEQAAADVTGWWILRRCVWRVPDFDVVRYRRQPVALDEQMRAGEPFVAHSTRHLVECRR